MVQRLLWGGDVAYFFHVSGRTRSRHPAEWKRCCAQAVRTVWWIWKTCWGGSGLTLYCKPVFPPDLFRQVAVTAAVQVSDTFLDEARGFGRYSGARSASNSSLKKVKKMLAHL